MRRILPLLVLATVVASSCSSDDDASTSTPAPSAADITVSTPEATEPAASTPVEDTTAFCAALTDLRASVDELSSFDLVAQGVDALTATMTDVKDQLAAVREAAGDGVRSKVDAVGTALDDLQSGVAAAGTLVAKGEALFSGLADLQLAVRTLLDAPEAAQCS